MISSREGLKNLVERCQQSEDSAWGILSLNSDLMSKSIEKTEKEEIVDRAASCGTFWARQMKERYPGQTVMEMLHTLGVSVYQENYDKPGKNMMIFFAQYKEGKIYLSRERIGDIQRLVEQNGLKEVLGEFDPASVLAAHEMFHYIESNNPDIATRNLKVKGCGFLKRRGCPYMASEIGAFAFSRELCGISFHPRVLEVIGLYERLPGTARNIVEGVCQ